MNGVNVTGKVLPPPALFLSKTQCPACAEILQFVFVPEFPPKKISPIIALPLLFLFRKKKKKENNLIQFLHTPHCLEQPRKAACPGGDEHLCPLWLGCGWGDGFGTITGTLGVGQGAGVRDALRWKGMLPVHHHPLLGEAELCGTCWALALLLP